MPFINLSSWVTGSLDRTALALITAVAWRLCSQHTKIHLWKEGVYHWNSCSDINSIWIQRYETPPNAAYYVQRKSDFLVYFLDRTEWCFTCLSAGSMPSVHLLCEGGQLGFFFTFLKKITIKKLKYIRHPNAIANYLFGQTIRQQRRSTCHVWQLHQNIWLHRTLPWLCF